MTFLAPAFLGLAALVGVPLAVHLLRRRIGRTVDFPAVRYLARMEREHSRELKLRHRLLLALRLLAVLLLAAAAARPIARMAGLGHAPVAVAIVLDNSLSTSAIVEGEAVLDALRREADGLLAALEPADVAWLVTSDGRIAGGTPTELRERLRAVQPLGGRGDLPSAIRRAGALAGSGAPRAPVVAIATDGQRSAFGAEGDSLVRVGDVPVVALATARSLPRNAAVLSAMPDPVRWSPNGALRFTVGAASGAPIAADSVAWRVELDGRTAARGRAATGSMAEPTVVEARMASSSTGWIRGVVELDPDELRGDDRRWFAVRAAPPPAVAVRPEAGPFLSVAIATLVEEGRLAADRGREGGAGPVVAVAGADAAGTRLPAFLTAPADPVRVGEANRALARLGVPWRFGAIARDLVLARQVPAATDAGGTGTTAPHAAVDGVAVRLRYPLLPSGGTGDAVPGADVVAMAGGAPWIVAGDGYLLLGSPLTPDATDLPLRAGFVPWLLTALSQRLASEGVVVEAVPGQRLAWPAGVTALELADGSLRPADGPVLTVPDSTGVYLLRRQAARVGALVVNAEPEESDVGAGVVSGVGLAGVLQSRLEARQVVAAADGAEWRRAVLAQTAGRSLVPLLVLLALLALALESWVGRAVAPAARSRATTAQGAADPGLSGAGAPATRG